MPIADPSWQQLAIYALLAAGAVMLMMRIPVLGRLIRFALSFALLAFCLFVLIQQAPYQPTLGRIAARLGLDRQEVVGREVRIRMSPDGHFWAKATVNGVPRKMLIDSGATLTAISSDTARMASVASDTSLTPVVLRTANGMAGAETATVNEIRIGNVVARRLKVVTSPALGELDVLGMNFLSKLASWRVEERTLILVPHHPQPPSAERRAAI
jgi:aspartyl protease family protein